MDFASLVELYRQGKASPLNVYQGLVTRLKRGESLDVLGTFPPDLLEVIRRIASRHYGVMNPVDKDEWEIAGRVCTWPGVVSDPDF